MKNYSGNRFILISINASILILAFSSICNGNNQRTYQLDSYVANAIQDMPNSVKGKIVSEYFFKGPSSYLSNEIKWNLDLERLALMNGEFESISELRKFREFPLRLRVISELSAEEINWLSRVNIALRTNFFDEERKMSSFDIIRDLKNRINNDPVFQRIPLNFIIDGNLEYLEKSGYPFDIQVKGRSYYDLIKMISFEGMMPAAYLQYPRFIIEGYTPPSNTRSVEINNATFDWLKLDGEGVDEGLGEKVESSDLEHKHSDQGP